MGATAWPRAANMRQLRCAKRRGTVSPVRGAGPGRGQPKMLCLVSFWWFLFQTKNKPAFVVPFCFSSKLKNALCSQGLTRAVVSIAQPACCQLAQVLQRSARPHGRQRSTKSSESSSRMCNVVLGPCSLEGAFAFTCTDGCIMNG